MLNAMVRVFSILVLVSALCTAFNIERVNGIESLAANEEYFGDIHPLFEAYGDAGASAGYGGRGDAGGFGGRGDYYRAWKRNADLINSLLTLPKGMNDAGR
ncbi:hypothetical protein JYU34_007390 [Plutella xylostella]|uniref:Uncharacterized protein n=1 Tax=Plutella xylostella TaxID=51655 RepID=A0ABQ7QQ91_PLUXY|nr:hypothetical protein JYU34_007390 [Plutella xylostella]